MHKERYKRIWESYDATKKEMNAELIRLRQAFRQLIKLGDERQKIYGTQNKIRTTNRIIRTLKEEGRTPHTQSTQNPEAKLTKARRLKQQYTQKISETLTTINKVKRQYFDIEEIQKR